ncbi:hypothetical protein J437_LFUL007412 [Ladona fulva]|uniref:trypsin n=1 Tax=Ladona fulva TaxID=123851 RepID=A0A8K0NWH0_LADFU|nr:hypothetical protein J437_LFUL007412 [Ladona fulva]
MFPLFILLALALSSAFSKPLTHTKHTQFNGTAKASINKFSYQASLIRRNSFICGAAVISPQWAITTAQCADVEEKEFLFLSVGSENIGSRESMIKVKEVILHPKYNKQTHDFDFALLKASLPFDHYLPNKIKPIPLAHSNAGVHQGDMAIVTGWGTVKGKHNHATKMLKYTSVTIFPQKECKHLRHRITNNMFCAQNLNNPKISCQGDTGGPLAIHGKLYGLVSWSQHCDTSKKPVVYARVSHVTKWIRKHVDDIAPYIQLARKAAEISPS